jgi:hypothetical protein
LRFTVALGLHIVRPKLTSAFGAELSMGQSTGTLLGCRSFSTGRETHTDSFLNLPILPLVAVPVVADPQKQGRCPPPTVQRLNIRAGD